MYFLAEIIPAVRRFRIPLSRDQMMLLMVAFNEFMLAVEIYLAHSISGTIVPYEWIPIIFGPIAGVLLVLAGISALRNRPLAIWISIPTFLASIGVGLLGAYFHLSRAILANAPIGQQISVSLTIWAPPVLAPLTFALVGVLGLSAIWVEKPVDSGNLIVFGNRHVQLPFSKTSGYFLWVSMAMLATLISSVLDHARTNFSNPWLWVPTAAGILGVVVSLGIGFLQKPEHGDIWVYFVSMLLIILVALIGLVLHVLSNLTADSTILGERFLRGAPILAPLLFADIASLGLVVLFNPDETATLSQDIIR
jgi:hypothetical protein